MRRITRRRFLQYGLGTGASLAVPWAGRVPAARAAKGGKLTKYLEAVPVPGAGIVVATEWTESILVHPNPDQPAASS
jgi:hypothetical protein